MPRMWLVLLLAAALAGCSGETAEQYLQEGLSNYQNHDYDAAISSYQKALKIEPSAVAYNNLGMAYRSKCHQQCKPELREQELAAFKQAAAADPKLWVALVNLGVTYYIMGDRAKAVPWFKKALEINPEHPEKAELEKIIAESEPQP
jgi:tetratricopeptide (TPR) repeat protein